jgi:hypothetical protein
VSRRECRVSDGALDVLFEDLGVIVGRRMVCRAGKRVARRSQAVCDRARRRKRESRDVGGAARGVAMEVPGLHNGGIRV